MLLTLIACMGSPPEPPGVVLGPLEPTTAEDLIASVDPVTDPDGDEVTLVYRWFRDAVEVEGQDSEDESTDLWFDIEEGRNSIDSLIHHFNDHPDETPEGVVDELRAFDQILEKAEEHDVRWHFEMDF